jgi:hypothetical protein
MVGHPDGWGWHLRVSGGFRMARNTLGTSRDPINRHRRRSLVCIASARRQSGTARLPVVNASASSALAGDCLSRRPEHRLSQT